MTPQPLSLRMIFYQTSLYQFVWDSKLHSLVLSSSAALRKRVVGSRAQAYRNRASQAVGSEDMASLNQSSTQVRQALLLLSNQIPQEATYRVARPSLGIRAGKLASPSHSSWISHGSLSYTNQPPSSGASLSSTSFFLRFFFYDGRSASNNHSTSSSTDCRSSESHRRHSEMMDRKQTRDGTFRLMVKEAFITDFLVLYVFREIEQNPAFHRLENHGFRMTLKTTELRMISKLVFS